MTPEAAVAAVREHLTDDLLKGRYAEAKHIDGQPATRGHCYIAAEAVWHLLGGRRGRFTPAVISGRKRRNGERDTHWFLRAGSNGHIVDPTFDQFLLTPPYHRARSCGFLTARPSKRTAELLRRILGT